MVIKSKKKHSLCYKVTKGAKLKKMSVCERAFLQGIDNYSINKVCKDIQKETSHRR